MAKAEGVHVLETGSKESSMIIRCNAINFFIFPGFNYTNMPWKHAVIKSFTPMGRFP